MKVLLHYFFMLQDRILTSPVLWRATLSGPTGKTCSTLWFSLQGSPLSSTPTDLSGDWTVQTRWRVSWVGRTSRAESTTPRATGKTSTSSSSTAPSGSPPHASTSETTSFKMFWHQKRCVGERDGHSDQSQFLHSLGLGYISALLSALFSRLAI